MIRVNVRDAATQADVGNQVAMLVVPLPREIAAVQELGASATTATTA